MYKIYRKTNYIFIEDVKKGQIYPGAVKEVFIDRNNLSRGVYRISNVKGWSATKPLAIESLYKEDDTAYTLEEFEEFYTQNTLNFNSGSESSPQNSLDTSFKSIAYNATTSKDYNENSPNFEIRLEGDLELTLNGTINGDSGIVNIYFPSSENVVLNGFENLELVGEGKMKPVYFIHDLDGLKWYSFSYEDVGLQPETSDFNRRTTESGGTVSQKDLLSIDKFILNGKTNGWWESQKDMCLFLKTNGGINSAIVKLKDTTNTPITNQGYLSSDVYDFGIYSGDSANTGKFLETNVGLADLGMTIQNFSATTFTPSQQANDFRYNGVIGAGYSYGSIFSNYVDEIVDTTFGMGVQGGNMFGTVTDSTNSLGLEIVTGNSTGISAYYNNVLSMKDQSAGTAVVPGKIVISKAKRYGVYFSNLPLSFYSLGTTISEDVAYKMGEDIYTLMKELGRIKFTESIIGLGDSLMFGTTVTHQRDTYMNLISNYLRLNNFHSGKPSRRLSTNESKLQSGISVYRGASYRGTKVATMFLALGRNDMGQTDINTNLFANPTILSTYRSNLVTICDYYIKNGYNVVLMSMAYSTDNLTNYALAKQLDYVKAASSVAKQMNQVKKINFINTFHLLIDNVSTLSPDGIHINTLGHKKFAEEIIRNLKDNSQIRKVTLVYGTVPAQTSAVNTITVLNAEVGMSVRVAPQTDLPDGVTCSGYVSADDTVIVKLYNSKVSAAIVLDTKFEVEVKTGY